MKKILVVTDNERTQVNGVVTTFKNIESYATATGYDIVYLDPGQFRHIDCPGYPEVKLSWAWFISDRIKAINPDFIHIATEGPIGLSARVWCERNKIPYNTSYHTKFPEYLKKIYKIPEWITYAYVRWFHKNSVCVLTTTDTMVNDLKQNGFKGNIKAWSRGTDKDVFNPSLREKRLANGIVLLSVGRVSKEKNLDEFCKLYYTNAKKIVVGDGPYRKELEKKYPDVHFVGTKFGKDLAFYYANSDVFVFTSKTDTFGVVNIEALSCGTPIAAYPVPGPIDIVKTGVNGYLSNDLMMAIDMCLTLKREKVYESSKKWTWQECWSIFEANLRSCG